MTPDEVRERLERIGRGLPRTVYQELRRNLLKSLPMIFRGEFRFRMKVVLDSNQAISACIGYCKHGHHVLLELIQYPFVEVVAPPEIDHEVPEKLKKKCAKSKVDAEQATTVWQSMVRPNLKIRRARDRTSTANAEEAIGERDAKDVPFVSIFFESDSDAILTDDPDIREAPGVQTWNTREFGRVCGSFRRGFVGMYLLDPIGTNLARFVFDVIRAVLDAIAELVDEVWKAISIVGREVGRFPGWLQVGLAVAAFYVADKYPEKVEALIAGIRRAADRLIEFVAGILKKLWEAIAPYVNLALTVAQVAIQDVLDLLATTKAMTGRTGHEAASPRHEFSRHHAT